MNSEKARDEFLDSIIDCVDYWDKVDGRNQKERLSGLAFSILTLIDGCSSSNDFKGYSIYLNDCEINKNCELHEEYCERERINNENQRNTD